MWSYFGHIFGLFLNSPKLEGNPDKIKILISSNQLQQFWQNLPSPRNQTKHIGHHPPIKIVPELSFKKREVNHGHHWKVWMVIKNNIYKISLPYKMLEVLINGVSKAPLSWPHHLRKLLRFFFFFFSLSAYPCQILGEIWSRETFFG